MKFNIFNKYLYILLLISVQGFSSISAPGEPEYRWERDPGLSLTYYPRVPIEEQKRFWDVHQSCFNRLDSQRKAAFSLKYKDSDFLRNYPYTLSPQDSKQKYVLKLDEEIIGFYSCGKDNLTLPGVGFIWGVCIAAEFRQKGYGSKLIETAQSKCQFRTDPRVALFVNVTNAKAIRVYTNAGFDYYWPIPEYRRALLPDGTFRYQGQLSQKHEKYRYAQYLYNTHNSYLMVWDPRSLH